MTEKISILQIRQRLGAILSRVALRNDQFIIEHNGKRRAAVVPVERFAMRRSVFACAGATNFSPIPGARPCGMKCSAKPGTSLSSGACFAHNRVIVGDTM